MNQIINRANLLADFLEHADKFFADNLTLAFRLDNTAQLAKETFARVDLNKVQVKLAERLFDLRRLVLAKESVVNKNACQILAYRFTQQHSRNTRINAATQRAEDFTVPDFVFKLRNRIDNEGTHLPIASDAADVHEV